jgi:hypothetical protein
MIPLSHGRLAADSIPGAKLVALDLDDHGGWFSDSFGPHADAIEE